MLLDQVMLERECAQFLRESSWEEIANRIDQLDERVRRAVQSELKIAIDGSLNRNTAIRFLHMCFTSQPDHRTDRMLRS